MTMFSLVNFYLLHEKLPLDALFQFVIDLILMINERYNGFELSGRGTSNRYLFHPLTSYNFASK